MSAERVRRTAKAPVAASPLKPKGERTRAPPMGPPEFIEAMRRDPVARRRFSALPEHERRDCIEWINAARLPATRAKRIGEAMARLAAGRAWQGTKPRP